jgi:hypothetical protein
MPPKYEPLGAAFSTADAEYPRLTLEQGSLVVNYRDWREQMVSLQFGDVVAFSWDDGDAVLADLPRDDQSYVVHDSPWLLRHLQSGSLDESTVCRHFVLSFNALGVLQVLASEVVVKA